MIILILVLNTQPICWDSSYDYLTPIYDAEKCEMLEEFFPDYIEWFAPELNKTS